MILTLQRKKPKSPGYPVLGRLTSSDGTLDLATLEDPYILKPNMISFDDQNKLGINWPFTCNKIKGVTAVPAGRYRVYNTWSPRFQKKLPLIVDVPGFTGIRIHSGQSAEHSEGCVIVGRYVQHERLITDGPEASDELVQFLSLAADEVWILINDPLI